LPIQTAFPADGLGPRDAGADYFCPDVCSKFPAGHAAMTYFRGRRLQTGVGSEKWL